MEISAFIIFAAIAALAIRLVAGSFDGDRVDQYVKERGGRLLTKTWSPFGKGWFGEKDSRIYEITFVDREGNTHQATCKTSMLSGVYFTEDRITARLKTAEPERGNAPDLAEENRRLRAELDRLKRGQG